MSGTYQGKNVRSQREARQGDPGFQQGQDQVVITLDSGEEKTVKKSEVQGGQGGQSQQQK